MLINQNGTIFTSKNVFIYDVQNSGRTIETAVIGCVFKRNG